jgi:hypothetical protein
MAARSAFAHLPEAFGASPAQDAGEPIRDAFIPDFRQETGRSGAISQNQQHM